MAAVDVSRVQSLIKLVRVHQLCSMARRRSSSRQQMVLSHCIASWRRIGKWLC